MATWVYPPIPAEQQHKAEDEALRLEVQWLLKSLQDALPLLKEGLEECVRLLAPNEPGSTLVLSSLRSESVKGFVTRVGPRIVKGDIQLRLATLPSNSSSSHSITNNSSSTPSIRLTLVPPSASSPGPTPGLVLPQLSAVRSLINDSLDVIDVSRWTGKPTDDASFIYGQLKLLHDHLRDAKAYMKGSGIGGINGNDTVVIPGGEWWLHSVRPEVFQPRQLPDMLSLHFTIQDANLVLTIRTLAPATMSPSLSLPPPPSSSPGGDGRGDGRRTGGGVTPSAELSPSLPQSAFALSGFGLRNKLLSLVGGAKPIPTHDEIGQIFTWHHGRSLGPNSSSSSGGGGTGGRTEEVIVREKTRVETGDPSLMSVAAKLSALEHEVARWRYNFRILMGIPDDDDDDDDDD